MEFLLVVIYFIILFVIAFPVFIVGDLLGFPMEHMSVEGSVVLLALPAVIMVIANKLLQNRDLKKQNRERQEQFNQRVEVVAQLADDIIMTYHLTQDFYKIEFSRSRPGEIVIYMQNGGDVNYYDFQGHGYTTPNRDRGFNDCFTYTGVELLCDELAKRLNGTVEKKYSSYGGYIPGTISADSHGKITIGRPESGSVDSLERISVYSKKEAQRVKEEKRKKENLKNW